MRRNPARLAGEGAMKYRLQFNAVPALDGGWRTLATVGDLAECLLGAKLVRERRQDGRFRAVDEAGVVVIAPLDHRWPQGKGPRAEPE